MVPIGVRQKSRGSANLFNLPLWIPVRITTLIKKQEHSYQRGTQRNTYHGTLILIFSLTYCEKKYDNKKYLLILCCFHSKDYPRCSNWTLDFEPAFSPRFCPYPEPTIHFSNWSAVSPSKSRDFRFR